jgi:hypothetical protein
LKSFEKLPPLIKKIQTCNPYQFTIREIAVKNASKVDITGYQLGGVGGIRTLIDVDPDRVFGSLRLCFETATLAWIPRNRWSRREVLLDAQRKFSKAVSVGRLRANHR